LICTQPTPVSRANTTVMDLGEDEQLEKAIAMSIAETIGSSDRLKRRATGDEDLEGVPESKRRKPSVQVIDDEEDDASLEAAIALSLAESKPTEEAAAAAAENSQKKDQKEEVTEIDPEIDENRPRDCTLQLRLPGGKSVQGLFNGEDKLAVVRSFIRKLPEAPKKPFGLATNFPRKVYNTSDSLTSSLKSLGVYYFWAVWLCVWT